MIQLTREALCISTDTWESTAMTYWEDNCIAMISTFKFVATFQQHFPRVYIGHIYISYLDFLIENVAADE